MLKAITDNLKGLYSLLVGLKITGKFFFSKQPTVYYPREVVDPEINVSYRGPLELIPNDEGRTRCISCMLCVRACPSNCLKVVKGKDKEDKKPVEWTYDFSLCSLCGTCVDVCPAKALKFSHHIYMVSYTREELKLNLLARLAEKAGNVPASGADGSDNTKDLTAPKPPASAQGQAEPPAEAAPKEA